MVSATVTINGEASSEAKKQLCDKAASDLRMKYISIVGESFGADDSVLKMILKLISMKGRKWNGVKLLNCSGNVGVVVEAILKAKARKLVLRDSSSDVLSQVGKTLSSNSTLLILELQGMAIDTEGAVPLFKGVATSSIMELSFEKSSFVGDAHVAFCEGLKASQSIQSLNLKGCGLSDEQCAVIMDSLVDHTSLLEINLEGNCCIKEGMNALSRVLKTTNLLVLDMAAQQSAGSKSVLQLKSFADSLKKSPIRYIQFSDNLIDDACMIELLRGVGLNSTIEILNLSWCPMSSRSLTALSQALCLNGGIRSVNLFGCNIDDQGMHVLAQSLGNWKAIKKIDLGGHQGYTKEGISDIMSRLQNNVYLEEVLLNRTSRGSNRFFLDANRGGRRFLMSKDNSPLGLWPNLLDRAQTVQLPRTSDLWLSNLSKGSDGDDCDEGKVESDESRRASVVFHLLREGLLPSI